jgi:CubicO group peptidase (beta-lactamase class C family)
MNWNVDFKTNRRLSTLFAVFCLVGALNESRADPVDDYVTRQMRLEHIPGLSLAIVKGGQITKARGYGLADVELDVPASKDTVYEIGSMTKPFTATAIMLLMEQGKIGLDNTITNYLTGLPAEWGKITVRHLLTHTSGIKGYLDIPNVLAATVSPISMTNLIKMVAPYPLALRPGDKFAYCITGYYLLGGIIESVNGKSYTDFLRDNLFDPLGMKATRLNDLKAYRQPRKRLYGAEWNAAARGLHGYDLGVCGRGPGLFSHRSGAVGRCALYGKGSAKGLSGANVDSGQVEQWRGGYIRFRLVHLWR